MRGWVVRGWACCVAELLRRLRVACGTTRGVLTALRLADFLLLTSLRLTCLHLAQCRRNNMLWMQLPRKVGGG